MASPPPSHTRARDAHTMKRAALTMKRADAKPSLDDTLDSTLQLGKLAANPAQALE